MQAEIEQKYRKHLQVLLASYEQLKGHSLRAGLSSDARDIFSQVYFGSFVLLSHGTEQDPLINFANFAAQNLWEMSLAELCGLPSRLTAEPLEREERARFLKEVSEKGYVDSYTGVRISKSKKRFLIKNAIVWNLSDLGKPYGQAAYFEHYEFL